MDDLARLTPEQYEWAIAIILARYPGAAAAAAAAAGGAAKTGAPGEELSLDLSAADALTLRQLQHFIAACLAAGGAPGDGPTAWPGLLVGSGAVRADCHLPHASAHSAAPSCAVGFSDRGPSSPRGSLWFAWSFCWVPGCLKAPSYAAPKGLQTRLRVVPVVVM